MYNNIDSEDCNEIILKIKELYNKYENNITMKTNLKNKIMVKLPIYLENLYNKELKKIERQEKIIRVQTVFIDDFFNQNKYYYTTPNNQFFYYNNIDYVITNEDEIIYNILSNISLNNNILTNWKHKTKVHMIKKIKQNNLLKSIPEEITIKNVINIFYPYLFDSIYETIYFLTIIGDNILKKNTEIDKIPNYIYHLIPENLKDIIKELHALILWHIGNNTSTNSFKFKYTNQLTDYTKYRILYINEDNININLKNKIKSNMLNIICVSSYFSNFYNNSENYLLTIDSKIKDNILYLSNNGFDNIIKSFIDKYLEFDKSNNNKILFKNIYFLWKFFLNNENKPNISNNKIFKNIIKNYLILNDEQDIFIDIKSKYLSNVQNFYLFFKNNIIQEENDIIDLNDDNFILNSFEINEISNLFKIWNNNNIVFTDKEIIFIIQFYPNILLQKINIVYNKYITNINCLIWNKKDDIHKSLDKLKKISLNKAIAIYDAYLFYCNDIKYNYDIVNYKCINHFNKDLYNINNENKINNDVVNYKIVNENYFKLFIHKFYKSNIIDNEYLLL